ncbi:flagellin N-terminal helical domain-containing protein [endosymbiont of Ridgeia piscesae]|uniref:Flagellin n=2 Tax=Bacteria TaxID=2 RepID=A0A0T5Z4Z2_9GAMM|nr:flagellin [endosymbiont of Ridgeia piscesae]KRT56377.1 Flagellin or hook-associated protein FlgL [endosymbiont of Ridgeia piscesae]KRT57729.1 flagellin [endosymbiont of Ridgeia piscesae]
MALVVNTNVMSLNAQRNLSSTQNDLAKSLQRLSSGLRVNSAKDDAAGLYQIEKMTADIRGLNQATRNAADGISLGQTAEGALGQIANNLQRIREIAVQSSNATVEDRTGLQKEVDQLTQEISRIVQTTEFNGTSLLSATASMSFQVGQDGKASHQVSVKTVDLTSLNAYASSLTATGTINVSSASAASAELSTASTGIENDITSVAQNRATFGAVQNRFEAVISNLSNYAENLTASRSRIQDADFAAETATLTKTQILQQAGVSILSQANVVPQSALALLQ